MTVFCDVCGEEKAKSQMYTAGLNGSPAVCKACNRGASIRMDEFSALRLCVQAIDKRDPQERHRIVKALISRYAV